MEKVIDVLRKIGITKIYWGLYKLAKMPKKLINRYVTRFNRYYTLRILFPRVYKKEAKQPLDENKVIFLEVRLEEISNSFRLIYEALVENYDFDIKAHFLKTRFSSRKEYNERAVAFLKDMATAKYIFINEACQLTSCVPLREGTEIIQTWHACGAFKKFGFSTADKIFGDNRETQLKYPYYKNMSYVTISSPEIAWAYEEAMNLSSQKEIIKPIGVSRTDIFYDKEFIAKAYERLYEVMPGAKGKKVILYAPTFRGRVARAKAPNEMNFDMFYEAFRDDYVILCKHHPFIKNPPEIDERYNDSFAKDVSHTMDIEDLLCVSDICISDYSSLVFEYSLFTRPILFFAYDLDEYFDWRGFYYDYFELTPGPVVKTNEEMIDYIKHVDERFDEQKVIDFRQKFMSACDGHATQRLLEIVFKDKLEAKKREVPLKKGSYEFPTA